MKEIKNYIIIILFAIIGILLFLKQCNNPEIITSKPKEIIIEKWDTVYAKPKIIQLPPIIKPKYDTIRDTIIGEITNIDSLFYVRTYNDSISDSNLTVYTSARTIGILEYNKIDYKLKVPKYITHTIEKTKTEIITQPSKVSIYTGIEVSGSNTSFNTSPFIDLNYKKVNIGARYGLLDKSIGLKVGYKLFSTKR